VQQIRMVPRRLTLSSVVVVFAMTATLATFAMAGSAAATSPAQASCSFNGASSGGLLTGIESGSAINVLCSGLPPSETVLISEESQLAQIASASDSIEEADLGDLKILDTSATGGLSAIFTLPTTFLAGDTNAQ